MSGLDDILRAAEHGFVHENSRPNSTPKTKSTQ